ncbi:MAG: hypothetical protein KBC62_00530 [Candidatus Pacebacteria bacterium]|nr:hypothetical protein [Candidatus Paceibacterota bacterium]
MAAEEQQQEGQKTLVAFIVGLLIGGMLVWAFSGPEVTAPTNDETTDESSSEVASDDKTDEAKDSAEDEREPVAAPTLKVGDGSVVVADQEASAKIALESATYPVSEGWIGVREYNNDQLGYILGVVRFSESQGLVPNEIVLQRSTTAGKQYAVVIYTEDGDRQFNLANDVQIDTIFDTFIAK